MDSQNSRTNEHPPRPEDAALQQEKSSTGSSSGEDGDDEEAAEAQDFHFATDAEADVVREEAVKLYNAGDYNRALDRQYRVVRYYAGKHGATSPAASKYFLDYALSQLRVLQSQSSIEDALKPRDEEAMETCFINLEIARVGLQKKEDEVENSIANAVFVETELMLAETHNALAQLSVEKEDFDGALKEYETELLIYRSLQEEEKEANATGNHNNKSVVPAGRLVAALYGIADCFAKEGDFAGAEERLVATLEEIAKYPAGTVAAELVEELNELLADAREMKGGKFAEIQAEIDKQFIVQDADKVPTAQEFYNGRVPTVMGANGEEKQNPYVTVVPSAQGHHSSLNEGSHLSMPLSASGAVLGFHGSGGSAHDGGNENSNSVSFFPPQQLSRSGPPASSSSTAAAPVTTVVARKKAKVPMGSPSASNSAPPVEPEMKKPRVEQ